MKIVVINDIHIGKALTHNGKVRAASHLIEDQFEEILGTIFRLHSPDLIINLGDIIRSEAKDLDLKRYSSQLSRLKQVPSPVIHLIGNHELKKLSQQDIENAWLEYGFQQKIYGSKEIKGYLLIWLGFELNQNSHPYRPVLPKLQMKWLKDTLQKTNKKVLIFSHYAIDDHDTIGNFFYEAMDGKSKQALFLHNQDDVREIIESSQYVKAVFQAHLHYFHVNIIKHIPYITCPAMGDNICAPQAVDNIPEIYTTVELNKRGIIVKAYSREYCFAGYEQCFE